MGSLWEYGLVFLLASVPMIEVVAAIPLGIVRGLSPVSVVATAFLGNLSTVILVIYLYDKIREYWVRKKGARKDFGKRQERARKIWNKYGLPGLGLLGPILIGIHVAAFIGLALGATKNWTLLWMTVSLAIWSVVLGIAFHYGVAAFKIFL